MSKLMWVAGAGIAAAWCWSATAQQTYSVDPAVGLGSRELVTHFQDQETGPTMLTVVDPQTRALAVYHINRETGAITLKSVRNFELDLRLMEYNAAGIKPDEIRKSFELQQTQH